MRLFLLICLGAYTIVFVYGLANSFYCNGDMLKALPAIVLSEPWFAIFGSLVGDKMSHPELVNEAIDDDCFSVIGLLVMAVAGIINPILIYGISMLLQKRN